MKFIDYQKWPKGVKYVNKMKDYNEKWYFIGTVVGIFAGITIGWFLFS